MLIGATQRRVEAALIWARRRPVPGCTRGDRPGLWHLAEPSAARARCGRIVMSGRGETEIAPTREQIAHDGACQRCCGLARPIELMP
jgi:hypothetical protein